MTFAIDGHLLKEWVDEERHILQFRVILIFMKSIPLMLPKWSFVYMLVLVSRLVLCGLTFRSYQMTKLQHEAASYWQRSFCKHIILTITLLVHERNRSALLSQVMTMFFMSPAKAVETTVIGNFPQLTKPMQFRISSSICDRWTMLESSVCFQDSSLWKGW